MCCPKVVYFRDLCRVGVALAISFEPVQASTMVVVATGDSLTNGYNYNQENPPTIIELDFIDSGTDASVVKLSTGGLRSTQYVGLEINPHNEDYRYYDDEVLAEDPDVILFMLGTNDAFQSDTYFYDEYQQYIGGVFDKFKAHLNSRGNHAKVVVAVPTPILSDSPGDTYDLANQRLDTLYAPWLRTTAPAYGFHLLDLNLLIQQESGWQDWYRDHVHFWGTGYDWMAQQFHDAALSLDRPADFDNDVDIDGSDFLSWQRGCRLTGAHHFEGDADGDQCVGASDLAIWRQDFGSATVATVPEPTAIVLMSVAAVCVGTLRRR